MKKLKIIGAAFSLVANLFAVEFDNKRFNPWGFDFHGDLGKAGISYDGDIVNGDAILEGKNVFITITWEESVCNEINIYHLIQYNDDDTMSMKYVETIKCSFRFTDLKAVVASLKDGTLEDKFGVVETPEPDMVKTDTPATSDAEPDFHMTADEFMISRTNGEANNELKWDLAHEGEIFHITGTVDRVMRRTAGYDFSQYNKDQPWARGVVKRIQDAELSDIISVSLDAPKARDHFDSINFTKHMRDPEVHFGPEYERVLSTLKRGDTIEVVGRYLTKTWNMGASAFGPTCKIVSITRGKKRLPVDPTPLGNVSEVEPKYDDLTNVPAEESLTASELFNVFYRDETGNDLHLENEWSGKVVEVTGKVVAVEKGRKGWIGDYANAGTAWGAWIKRGDQPDGYIAVTLEVDTIDKRFQTKAEGVVITLNFDKKHIRDLITLETGHEIVAKGRVLLGNGPLANQLLNCRNYGLSLQIGPTCSIVKPNQ